VTFRVFEFVPDGLSRFGRTLEFHINRRKAMRAIGKWVLAFGLLAVAVSTVRSEEPKKHILPEEGAVELVLLRQKSVQEELKLTKDQIDKIHTFADGQWKKAQELHKLEEGKTKAQFEELGKENRKFVHEALNADQHKRLVQISIQVAGLIWALDPKVSKELNLTADQKTKIEALHKTAHKEVHEVLQATDKTQRMAKMDALREAHGKQLLAVLTDEQKTKWKELAGEPFKGAFHFADLDDGKGK